MGYVPARRRRRKKSFDRNPIRRAEIIRHAIYVGAMETEDRDRWLFAFALHNHSADPVWGVIRAAQKMGGEISEAEAVDAVNKANAEPHAWSDDKMARFLGMTYAVRQRLRLRTIGAKDVGWRERKNLRRERALIAKAKKRRAAGMRPRDEYEDNSVAAQARAEGVSRMTIYRRKRAEQAKNHPDVTGVTTTRLLTVVARPVTGERAESLSSRTATTMAADIHESLPLELRLLALGLPMPESLARAA